MIGLVYLTSLKKHLKEIRRWKSRGGIRKYVRKREKEKLPWPDYCTLHILTNFNNTFVTVSNALNGQIVVWASTGTCKFKNAKKKSAYAAKIVLKKILKRLLRKKESFFLKKEVNKLNIIMSGTRWSKMPSRYFIKSQLCLEPNQNKRRPPVSLSDSSKNQKRNRIGCWRPRRPRTRRRDQRPPDPISINLIKDVTPFPHNGCRPRKRRRKKKRTRRRFRKLPRHPKTWLNLKDRLLRRKRMFETRKKAKRRKKRPKIRIREAISFLREFYKTKVPIT